MKQGYLSQYFEGVAVKQLSAVEADVVHSNQHEYHGDIGLKQLFGSVDGIEKKKFPAKFVYLTDSEEEPVTDEGPDCFLTWYDARARSSARTGRSEYRLYFPTTTVSQCAAEGDLLVLGRLGSGLVLVLIAERESSIASQLKWLFGVGNLSLPGFAVRGDLEEESDRIGFAERVVLEQIGIEVIEPKAEDYLTDMLTQFGRAFPQTRVFSAYARNTLKDIAPADDPDAALMAWMEREELLFRTLERELVRERLERGFAGDVDGFLQFSLSVQNRRKSRVGAALESHLASIFDSCLIQYSRTEPTENKSKPDFLFPGIKEYRQHDFAVDRLTMLGAKTTCKDRWRQVLSEAARIENKHLLTLEVAISQPQTDEMRAHKLQLVIPRSLHSTFTAEQQSWLMNVRDFVGMVRVRQP
ncbi:type II restriction endonuclease [Povalibacter sp.]|uniref:type II restriction endonuclease n=1 Tax=Povalibacter sp. TaxID=1962978 RepID=UPI002F3F64A4